MLYIYIELNTDNDVTNARCFEGPEGKDLRYLRDELCS